MKATSAPWPMVHASSVGALFGESDVQNRMSAKPYELRVTSMTTPKGSLWRLSESIFGPGPAATELCKAARSANA